MGGEEGIDWSSWTKSLEQIGVIASQSTENSAIMVLQEGKEGTVTNETLVLIDNRAGNKILAVCRGGFGYNDALRTSAYTPGIAYAKRGHGPSSSKEYFGFRLVVIGDVTDGTVKQNTMIIAPGSPVYRFNERLNPMNFLYRSRFTVGYYAKGHKSWTIPLMADYLSHHIGVFGVTGSGKSFLCRYQLIPLLREYGYDVLVLDWKGSDYAPYYPDNVISMGDVELDDSAVVSYLAEALGYFGGGDSGMRMVSYLEEVISTSEWRGRTATETKERLLYNLLDVIKEDNLEPTGKLGRWGYIYQRKAMRAFERLSPDDLKPLMGTMKPSEIIQLLREKGVLVMDLSYGSKEQKLSVFLSLTRYLKRLMEEKNELRIALLIDEAPQYCPWQPRGLEEKTTKTLIELAALGRSYKLSLTLVSQGIAGEIGINAAVRRNLNTLFIGRIHPLDAPEAERYFANSFVTSDSLLRLPEGHFYIVGKVNPSPVPLLMTFEIPEHERVGWGGG
ncbi:MAG: ATP-binding protein [Nitrososphaerota archaeon]|nr:ATP-binding protein [Candidatus Calditenuis fumarioli]